MATSTRRPTPRQLSYLRSLAERTGQTFTYPATSADAGREIARLKNARPSTRAERRIERKLIADEIAAGPAGAARVRGDEISGHGSSATWTQNRQQGTPPTPGLGPPEAAPKTPKFGERTELTRYTVGEGERIVYGQRIDGVVRVTDRPAAQGGRAYLVERGLESKAELDALVADYLEQATRLDRPPMLGSADSDGR